MTATIATGTVETFLAMARVAILDNADLKPDERDRLSHVKVTYGAGDAGVRGVTYYGAWKLGVDGQDETTDFIELAAMTQESWIQLAGTLLHELGHSLAGMGTGHSKDWKDACVRLGFAKLPAAAGQRYWLSFFQPQLRLALYEIAQYLKDGTPNFWSNAYFGSGANGSGATVRPCRAGQGTRGGKSRGAGSGSRLRLWECGCDKPIKVRVASDDFQAHCDRCEQPFTQQ